MDLFDNVVDIKKANNKKKYKKNEQTNLFKQFENIEPKNLMEIIDFFNNKLSKLQKLDKCIKTNSLFFKDFSFQIEKLLYEDNNESQFIINIEINADLVYMIPEGPLELAYPYSSSEVAQALGISSSQVGKMMKELKIKDNDLFHFEYKNGKQKIQRYCAVALYEVFARIEAPNNYNIPYEITKYWDKKIDKSILKQEMAVS